jgi:lysozyme family protein
MGNRFDVFFDMLVKNEGWYSNDKNDSGKETILGVSSKSFPAQFKTIKGFYDLGDMVNAKNAARKFYYDEFYNPLYENISNEQLAFRLFDFGVNAGKTKSVILVQQAVNDTSQISKIEVDGIFGNGTLEAINTLYNSDLYDNYILRIEDYYKSLNKPQFLKGWLNRLKRLITLTYLRGVK